MHKTSIPQLQANADPLPLKLGQYIFERWTQNKEWRQVLRLSPQEFCRIIDECNTLRSAILVMWEHCVQLQQFYPHKLPTHGHWSFLLDLRTHVNSKELV